MPPGIAAGEATVNVLRNGALTHTGKLPILSAAPAIFTANANGVGVPAAIALRVAANGAQTTETIAQLVNNRWQTKPINLGPTGERVFLILFLCGIRNLPNSDGNSGNGVAENVRVLLGGIETTPSFAAKQGGLAGVDQINAEVPRTLLGRGKVSLSVLGGGLSSNTAEIEIAAATGATPPTVASFAPTLATASETLTINGSGFAANSVALINGQEVALESATATQLIARVPFGAETGRVAVRTTQGEGTSASNVSLRTTLSGLATDTNGNPLPGVEVSYGTVKATTRNDGTYLLRDLTAGFGALKIDPSKLPLTPAMQPYSKLAAVTANRDNPQAAVALQPITGAAASIQSQTSGADENTVTAQRVLAPTGSISTNGLTFSFPDNITGMFPPGVPAGRLYLTLVSNSRAPAPLPAGVFSSAIAQLTPFGVKLTPGAKLSFPNSDGLPANAAARLYKLDQTAGSTTLGQFVDVGTATVSTDGARVETGANAITETSMYFAALPRPLTTVAGRVVESDTTTPVRRALVRASGQETFTDGNGGFVLRNVAVSSNNQFNLEASFIRPTGRTDRVARTNVSAVVNGLTRVTPDLVLPSPVTQPNRPPVLVAPTTLAVNEATTQDFPLLASDPDPNQTVAVTVSGAAFASVVTNQGVFLLRLAPGAGTAGNYTLTLRATDNLNASTTQTVAVTVLPPPNRPPVLSVPAAQTVAEGQPLNFTVSALDPDAGQTLTFSAANLPANASFNAATRQFTWTPGFTQAGNYTVTFTVTDNGAPPLGDSKTVALTVTNVNRAPVANAQSITLAEDAAQTITLTATDADGDALTYSIVAAPANGILSGTPPNVTYTPRLNFNGADSFTFKARDASADSNTATISLTITPVNDKPIVNVPGAQTASTGVALTFTISATDADTGQTFTFAATSLPSGASLNATSGVFTWTPTQTGVFTVSFTATDNGTPPLTSDAKTVTITVNAPANRPPVANAQTVATNEDTARAITLTGSDADNDPLTYSIVTPPTRGALTGTGANLTYTPTANLNGADSFTFKVNDGKADSAPATVTINVAAINDKPVVNVPAAQSATTSVQLTFNISASDVDTGQTFTFAATGLPAGATLNPTSGAFAWTPTATQIGTFTVSFTATDNGTPPLTSDAKTVVITVSNTTPPIANAQTVTTPEDTAKAITLTGSDSANRPLTYAVTSQPANGVLSGTAPNLSYTPALNFNGADSFKFRVNNGQTNSSEATVTLNVTPVNDAPVLTVPGPQTVAAGQPLTFNVTATDPDAGQFLVITANNLPAGADFSNDQFSWTPTLQQVGSFTVSFTATDTGSPALSDTKTVAITVTGGAAQWTQTKGPFGGQIYTLLVSEGILFAGTEGGVFRSTDGGNNWTSVNNGLGNQYVDCLAANGATLFAGASGSGVYRSTDNGANWTQVNNGLGSQRILSLAVSDTALFAGTFGGGVFRTTDNGANWTQVNNGLGELRIESLAVSGTLLFAGTNRTGVYRSVDNGANWTQVNNGLFSTSNIILAVSGATLFAGTNGGGVYRTIDNGANWVRINNGIGNQSVLSFAANGTTIFAGTFNGVYRTTDNGTNWTQVNNGLGNNNFSSRYVYSLALNGSILFAGTFGSGVYRTSDNGANWTQTNNGLSCLIALSMTVNGTILFAGTDVGVYRTADNGTNWTQVDNGFRSQVVQSLVMSGATLFAGTDGGVYRTNDNGVNWTQVNNGLSYQFVTSLVVSGTTLFAGTDGGGVYRTTDNGANWTQVNNGLSHQSVRSLVVSGTTLFAGTDGGVYRTTDNGVNWMQVNNGLGSQLVLCLAVNGATLFAGTFNSGVYRTTNNGASWTQVNNGRGNQYVNSLAVSGTTLYAGTIYTGVYRTTDNGATWTAFNDGLTNLNVVSLAVSGNNLFAGTAGSSVFVRPLP